MKNIFLCLLLFSVPLVTEASKVTFADIQKRVTNRDDITKAIITIDNKLRFRLTIEGEVAKVEIYKPMKVKDPNMEKYIFKVTDEILQERTRLELRKELQAVIDKCHLSERKFRISKYKDHKLSLGMPYEDVKKLVGEEFKDVGPPRTLLGSMSIESNEYLIEFRGFKLFDIIEKK